MGTLRRLAATFARIGDRRGPSPRPEALERLERITSPTAYRDIVPSLGLVKAPGSGSLNTDRCIQKHYRLINIVDAVQRVEHKQ